MPSLRQIAAYAALIDTPGPPTEQRAEALINRDVRTSCNWKGI